MDTEFVNMAMPNGTPESQGANDDMYALPDTYAFDSSIFANDMPVSPEFSEFFSFGTSPESGNSSGDSVSDTSSKRATSRASSKPTSPGGDLVLSDGLDPKQEWPDNTLANLTASPGTVNPASIGYDTPSGLPYSIPMPYPPSGACSPAAGFPMTTSTDMSPNVPYFEPWHLRNLPPNLGPTSDNIQRQNSHYPARNDAAPQGGPHPPVIFGASSAPGPATGASQWLGSAAGVSFGMGQRQMQVPMRPQLAPNPGPTGPYELLIENLCGKSRVETQVTVNMSLFPAIHGIRRLHLPVYTISRPKHYAENNQPSPDMLELHTAVVCMSAMRKPELYDAAMARARKQAALVRTPLASGDGDEKELTPQDGGYVEICETCINRERKRWSRSGQTKKLKVKPRPGEDVWIATEKQRVIVFNGPEILDWTLPDPQNAHMMAPMSLETNMRIACYCRHHAEKMGFRVIFTLTDYQGNLVAQTMSDTIMITDDHKTATGPDQPNTPPDANGPVPKQSRPTAARPRPRSAAAAGTPGPVTPRGRSHPPMVPEGSRKTSRQPSPSAPGFQPVKRRKPSGSARIPDDLAITPLNATPAPVSQAGGSASTTPPPTVSPISLGSMPPFQTTMMIPAAGLAPIRPSAPLSPVDGQSMPNLVAEPPSDYRNLPIFSAPGSARPSRASSPSRMAASSGPPQINGHALQMAVDNLRLPQADNVPAPMMRPVPIHVHRLIPAEGPTSGCIDVTILGRGFVNGMDVMFGDFPATSTTFWSETTLICLVPPSVSPGSVPVTLRYQGIPFVQQHDVRLFKYIDDDEQQLMRIAIATLGNKLTGKWGFDDISQLSRGIISGFGASFDQNNGNMDGGQTTSRSFESQLLQLLEYIDLDDSTNKPHYDLRRSTGQSMLHLACQAGFQRFVAGLLARGATADLRDRGGYTPLHMAALNDRPEIVRRLVAHGADPTIRTLSGLTPADIAPSEAVRRALRLVESHTRSRSGVSLPSRASSATSLRSLWEPMARLTTKEVSDDELESDEEVSVSSDSDSEESYEDDHGDHDGHPWLEMQSRRCSTHEPILQEADFEQPQQSTEHEASPGPTTAAMAAIKEQVSAQLQQLQQLQQTMALHLHPQLQRFLQFSYLPQMPNMPVLPDYQGANVVQRLASMMPAAIAGLRPGSSGDQGPPTEKEFAASPWWNLSSKVSELTHTQPQEPPRYDDLYPEEQSAASETKTASAARAAVDAEADSKCAALFDTQQQETAEGSGSETSATMDDESGQEDLPTLLQIGRKNAITKEQQKNLRRAHAVKLRGLSNDRKLFFVWIPLLFVVMFAMLCNNTRLSSAARSVIWSNPANGLQQQPIKTREQLATGPADAVIPPTQVQLLGQV